MKETINFENNGPENTSVPSPENDKSLFNRILESRIGEKFLGKIKPISRVALALMLSLQPMATKGQERNEVGLDKNKLEDTRTTETTNTIGKTDKDFYLKIDHGFITEDTEGERKFNPIGIVLPASVEIGTNETTKGRTKIEVPLTWAPDFRNTELSKEDSLEMTKQFEEQIRKAFANELIRIGETKGVYRANHEGENDLLENPFTELKVTSIKITGYSSPEGSTPKSIIPGNKEQKNIELAEKRAQITEDVIKKILEEDEIDPLVLDSINFEEVQFSDNEWNSLSETANRLEIKGESQEDQILELVYRYNHGEYNGNDDVKKIMDEIVGSKRGAKIEIEYEKNQKTQVVIALPLLLLLLLSKRVRKGIFGSKKPGTEPDPKPKPGTEKQKEVGGTEGDSKKPGDEIAKKQTNLEDKIKPDEPKKEKEQKTLNEISQEEYDAMYEDLKMLNKKIRESKGIITVTESDFKSEYGKKRYMDLKSIQEGIPVRFNKYEFQIIGDELESLLSNSKIISKEEIAKKIKEKEKAESLENEMRHDIDMLYKKIKDSKGIITLNESDFYSDLGKEQYKKLKSIPEGKNITFNKYELEIILAEIEKALINHQKKINGGDNETKISEQKIEKGEEVEPEIKAPSPIKEKPINKVSERDNTSETVLNPENETPIVKNPETNKAPVNEKENNEWDNRQPRVSPEMIMPFFEPQNGGFFNRMSRKAKEIMTNAYEGIYQIPRLNKLVGKMEIAYNQFWIDRKQQKASELKDRYDSLDLKNQFINQARDEMEKTAQMLGENGFSGSGDMAIRLDKMKREQIKIANKKDKLQTRIEKRENRIKLFTNARDAIADRLITHYERILSPMESKLEALKAKQNENELFCIGADAKIDEQYAKIKQLEEIKGRMEKSFIDMGFSDRKIRRDSAVKELSEQIKNLYLNVQSQKAQNAERRRVINKKVAKIEAKADPYRNKKNEFIRVKDNRPINFNLNEREEIREFRGSEQTESYPRRENRDRYYYDARENETENEYRESVFENMESVSGSIAKYNTYIEKDSGKNYLKINEEEILRATRVLRSTQMTTKNFKRLISQYYKVKKIPESEYIQIINNYKK